MTDRMPPEIRTLTNVHNGAFVVALLLGAVYMGLWAGITPEDACLPLGLTALVMGLATYLYAASKDNPYWRRPEVEEWTSSIRRMCGINVAVALLLLAYPAVS